MPAAIEAVVFDFGGVLITPITQRIGELAERHGVAMVDLLDVLMGPRERSSDDHPWHRAERGEIPISSLPVDVVPFAAAAGIALAGDEYDVLLDGVFDVHHDIVDRIGELRRDGYTTGLLTNSFREFRPVLEERIRMDVFDLVVDSSEVGHRKPEPAIYALTTERLGVEPASILYLDDFAANVDGARAAGWTTIHVTDAATVIADLDAVLGAP